MDEGLLSMSISPLCVRARPAVPLGWTCIVGMCERLMSFDDIAASALKCITLSVLISFKSLCLILEITAIILFSDVLNFVTFSMTASFFVRLTISSWSFICPSNKRVPFYPLTCKLLSKLMLTVATVPDQRDFDVVGPIATSTVSLEPPWK